MLGIILFYLLLIPGEDNKIFIFLNNQFNNQIFRDENNKPTCNLQIIPPKHRFASLATFTFIDKLKLLLKKYKIVHLITGNKSIQLNTRTDAIRIQSLTHYLLSAPKFKCMVQYAWYASKLAEDREIFFNVNQICFPPNIFNNKCVCKKHNSFIKCSWCEKVLYFECFYTNFHP